MTNARSLNIFQKQSERVSTGKEVEWITIYPENFFKELINDTYLTDNNNNNIR